MKELLRDNKFKIIGVIIFILFLGFLFVKIDRDNIIPDHIHSIDDKPSEQRTAEDSITILERSLQKEPDNIKIMIELSDLYLKTGRKKLAKKTLLKILEIDPSNKETNERLKQLE